MMLGSKVIISHGDGVLQVLLGTKALVAEKDFCFAKIRSD